MIPVRFTQDDANRAHDEWGANCGPGALAAIMGMTLDEARPRLIGFDAKGYTNPTMMFDALKSVSADFAVRRFPDGRYCDLDWPLFGLARIQWEGPWTNPGVPMRARYRYTHWVVIAPHLIAQYPRASGKWHITHAIEVTHA